MIKRNRPEFLRRYVTMDETWLYHFTPNSNRRSSEWTAHDEPAPERKKTQQSAGKQNKSYYKNGIERLEGRYSQCITLEGNYVE
ncbi:hypothetical protein GWI33_015324 [Rhynchophorus ferrugineus]|uniref:Transposase n=1 Tax=Rhynchophorus ferrugineus TaxID=354439 RepID=A0A834HZK9_RHYFE|nr:hypothetical protein GWI33_015324 [Rhynchophorus ferrugineus]